VGSIEDVAFLTRALTGATAVFALIAADLKAPNLRAQQNRQAEAYAAALGKAGVNRLVNLSSLGAHLSSGTGPIAGLHDGEQIYNRLKGVHVVHLRPTYFMENHLYSIGLIKGMGINGGALTADVKMGLIATRDIGAYAARRLLALDFTGKDVQELIGSRDVSPQEMTSALGAAIGKADLKWVQFPDADALQAMQGMGISPSVAGSFIDMSRWIREGGGNVVIRDAANTTPTTPEQFAKEVFAPIYNAAG